MPITYVSGYNYNQTRIHRNTILLMYETAHRAMSFFTDNKCYFTFGIPFEKSLEHFSSDFKTAFGGYI